MTANVRNIYLQETINRREDPILIVIDTQIRKVML
jgi:hypothetical protein